jgi:hypothetical protein
MATNHEVRRNTDSLLHTALPSTLAIHISVEVDYAGDAAAADGSDRRTSAPKGNHENRDGGSDPQQ